MGHLRLGKLRSTRKWKEVVVLLGSGADVAALADATAHAAESEFRSAKGDPALGQTVWLLTQLPLAARSDQFSERLNELGFTPGSDRSLFDLVSGFVGAVETHIAGSAGRTDLGEMARLAAAESLTVMIGAGLPTLFDVTPKDLQVELARFATKARFGDLARDFFARLTRKSLEYYLCRALPDHMGPGAAVANIHQEIAFRSALNLHAVEASEIVEIFAGGWFSKANYLGQLTPKAAQGFADYSLKKLREELLRRRGDDD